MKFTVRTSAWITLTIAPTFAHAWTLDWKWLKANIFDRIEISGSRTLGYHTYSVEGDREAFESLNYYGQGGRTWTDVGAMSFQGRNVAGFANFRAAVDTNRYRDPNAQHVSLDYEGKRFKVHLGDIQGSLINTNRFASFNKTLKGASAEYLSGKFRAKAVYSEARGAAQTISFNGNNTAGPYFLNASQLVPGSESVEVDGIRMKLIDDYVIRYEYGEITFVNRIIAPTSTVVISFESYGINSSRGTIQGASTTYDMGKSGRIGITAMRQISSGGSALSTRRELFQGAGAPSTPYFLEFEPLLTRPIRVLLNGIEQVENVHYRFDPDNPTIFFFLFFVPNSSTIEVIYTPRPTTTVNGDREVIGFDYTLPIGDGIALRTPGAPEATRNQKRNGGEVRYFQATGKLKNEASPSSGTARGVEARYNLGDYQFRAGWRDIPDGYVSIESRGFARNEKAIDAGVQYQKDGLTVDLSGNANDISVRGVNSGGGTVFTRAETTRLNAGIAYNKIVGEPWRLDLNSLRSSQERGDTKLDTATLSTSRSFNDVILRLNLETQRGSGPVAEGSKFVDKSISLNTIRLEANYNPAEAWSIIGRASVSAVRADEDSGTGKDYSLGIEYNPTPKLNVGVVYALSDAGQLALLSGFQTGYGLGYNGNGFSGGLNNTFTAGVTNLEVVNFHGRYEINDQLSLVGLIERAKTTGSYSSNSESDRFDIGVDWNLGEKAIIGLNLNQSQTRFLESPITTTATTLNAHILARPAKRWTMAASASYLLTGGTSEFNQDTIHLDGSIGYLIDDRQRLNATFRTGRIRGFLPQNDDGYDFSYIYRLYRNVSLVGSYKYRNVSNLDKSGAGAYRAKGFDIELRIGF